MDLAPVQALLKKLEADAIADLEAMLIPALLQEAELALPAQYKPFEDAIIAAIQQPLQDALAKLLAKV